MHRALKQVIQICGNLFISSIQDVSGGLLLFVIKFKQLHISGNKRTKKLNSEKKKQLIIYDENGRLDLFETLISMYIRVSKLKSVCFYYFF